jgi:DNA-binding MarR family transcriptional regulator
LSSQVLTPQPSPKPALTAWFRLLRGQAAARRTLEAGLQSAHGLTVVGYEALLLLSEAKEQALRRVDLARALGLTPSGVTRLLDGLEREGLVEKRTCEHDARVTYAALTEAGADRLVKASCSHVGSVRALFEERYTDEELETLATLLGRLPQ